ncbi:P-loop containing nucleoside triphosphate hydrolase protein [Corynespora cassiicola Philippines]|uniref:P-loop containing nucleoside triphosphate hydrolase protein n=1 Tax=Corynespora cassiicola Philippines TaxID=1448308 RepID=A0A2T2NWV3_CORCC|nr:P-loop containing nucleoside triphosphate hydrolase protein [Corynespora cassiicola Philippines]
MTGNSHLVRSHEDQTAREYFHHSSGQRVNTNVVLVEALRKQYPQLNLIITPVSSFNLLAYAAAGYATATPLEDSAKDPVYGQAIKWRQYAPTSRRLDSGPGAIYEKVIFAKFLYKWKGIEFLLYIANERDGTAYYPDITNHYILTSEPHKVDELMKEATVWGVELHDEVWVFDSGYWQKSRELWNSVQGSKWDNVILDEDMKKAIIADVENFFDGQETYEKLKVPWKRGIIYYGPPGNGKTISIKAMMHQLYQRGKDGDKRLSVPTLYVRSLASFGGPEYALSQIFSKARQTAPCYLVFEDLDSIVNDSVRSYFLNEVDGLKSNDGILMVGSTNHLDRLDPGISKRPSRFDRKYFFPDPDYKQRVAYAQFWQNKLKDNDRIAFPDKLCSAIAKITEKFSFAYMQEAFVASLLAIAARGDQSQHMAEWQASRWAGPEDPIMLAAEQAMVDRFNRQEDAPDPDLDELMLWVEIQKQVKILREEMEEESRGRAAEQQAQAQAQHSYQDELDAMLHGRRFGQLFNSGSYEDIGLAKQAFAKMF